MEDAKMNNEERVFKEEIDEDEEEYKKNFEEEKFTLANTLDLASAGAGARVVVANPGASTAILRILLEADLKDAGEVKATKKEKEKTVVTAKYSAKHNLIVLFIESDLESQYCGQISKLIWKTLGTNASYIGLSTTYKTNYSTFDGHMSIDSERSLPIRYIKSAK
jgi:hypothetical protein|tara:strand:+ start:75 stop:569 length:495 start_codon:yes stop_codon:yes gene_type:complete